MRASTKWDWSPDQQNFSTEEDVSDSAYPLDLRLAALRLLRYSFLRGLYGWPYCLLTM